MALFFETTSLKIYESFEKILKKKKRKKKAESSRSLSPNKQKVKYSQLTGTATTKTTFKSEWKKEFPFITSVPNDVTASKR